MPVSIPPRGTGRPDYSEDIYTQPVPEIRGPIDAFTYVSDIITIPANSSKSVTIEVPAGKSAFISNIYITANSDALLMAELYEYVSGQWQLLARYYGYGKIEIDIFYGRPMVTHRFDIYNESDKDVDVTVMEYGVMAYPKLVEYMLTTITP